MNDTPEWVKRAKPGDKVVCLTDSPTNGVSHFVKGNVYTIDDIQEVTGRCVETHLKITVLSVRILEFMFNPLTGCNLWIGVGGFKPVKNTDISVFEQMLNKVGA